MSYIGLLSQAKPPVKNAATIGQGVVQNDNETGLIYNAFKLDTAVRDSFKNCVGSVAGFLNDDSLKDIVAWSNSNVYIFLGTEQPDSFQLYCTLHFPAGSFVGKSSQDPCMGSEVQIYDWDSSGTRDYCKEDRKDKFYFTKAAPNSIPSLMIQFHLQAYFILQSGIYMMQKKCI